jgi:hypothetical protein
LPVREKDGLSAIKPNLESVILAGSHEFGRAQLTEGFHVILLAALSDCVQVGGRLIAFQGATLVDVSFIPHDHAVKSSSSQNAGSAASEASSRRRTTPHTKSGKCNRLKVKCARWQEENKDRGDLFASR